MNTTLTWQAGKRAGAADLCFEEDAIPEYKTREKIEEILKNAGYEGHVVLHTVSMNEDKFALYKWNHFEWDQIVTIVEGAISMDFPEIRFKGHIPVRHE